MHQEPTTKLDPKIKKVWRINSLIETAIISIILFGTFIILEINLRISLLWILIPVAVLVLRIVVNYIIYPNIKYSRWRYDVRDDEICIRKGLFFISSIVIPIVRVQFTDTSHGPILRAFGLANVSITTAGGDQSIPGLSFEVADELRNKIANLAKLLQESV